MTRGIAVLFALATSMMTRGQGHFSPVTYFNVGDSIRTDINLITDPAGIPEKYMAHVVTPVCENDKCYLVELDISWDILGGYSGLDTIPGKGLTKLDHIPLTAADYRKLNEILGDPASPLSYYSSEELVSSTRSSKIDGLTGATIGEISGSVIEGAVYSCHTLWHIVHGQAVDSIQKVTASRLDPGLVGKLTDPGDQESWYFLINHFSDRDFRTYLPRILASIKQGEGYYPKHAIEKLPDEIMGSSHAQQFFAGYFSETDYFTQVALLERLVRVPVGRELRSGLEKQLTERESYRNDLIKEIIR